MPQIYNKDYVDKVALLEKRVGHKVGYSLIEPFSFKSRDIIEVQRAAKTLASFVGLIDYLFIPAIKTQKTGVGGNIELNHSEREVYIELSEATAEYPEAVLATLAHEISHKYLHINGISMGRGPAYQFENEVLTDITAVFLGFGKLMLNGYECQSYGRVLKTGYLDLNQLAFVYLLVCTMRKIAPNKYEKNLNTYALSALQFCRKAWEDHLCADWHDSDVRSEVVGEFLSEVSEFQKALSNINTKLLYIHNASVIPTESFLTKAHRRMYELTLCSNQAQEDSNVDPCLKYLNVLRLRNSVGEWKLEVNGLLAKAKAFEESITNVAALVQSLGDSFPQPSTEVFKTIRCGNCDHDVALSDGNDIQVLECTKCHYRFVAQAFPPTFAAAKKTPESTQGEFSNKIKTLFRGRQG